MRISIIQEERRPNRTPANTIDV